jgi:hypothetical protein
VWWLALACPRPPPPTPSAALTEPGAVPAACAGADLRLESILADEACDVPMAAAPALPKGVVVRVDPPLVGRGGTRLESRLVVENTTAAPVTVHLDRRCPLEWQVVVQILRRDGERADRAGRECGSGTGCVAGRVARLSPADAPRSRSPWI